MKSRDLRRLGIPDGRCMDVAWQAMAAARQAGWPLREVRAELKKLARDPEGYVADDLFGPLALLLQQPAPAPRERAPRQEPAPHRVWGRNHDPEALRQMERAVRLPISVMGALMPDAHVGYGLPIGGVLATEGAVIPYAVGMDIACRMRMSVLDLPLVALDTQSGRLRDALERETRFGVGASFKNRRQHAVLDESWSLSPVTRRLKDKAWAQLGTSGSGNHFVEYGVLDVMEEGLGVPPGKYLALLSHSGSRGTGSQIATHYSRLAQKLHRELPRELAQLAWLDLDSEPGQEYWAAMELMGRYAAANHELIHHNVLEALGAEALAGVENHHNFAWKEIHETPDGRRRRVIVHRKGATPAGPGALGIIPGSMGTPGFVVRGRGEKASLSSAAHGAGRRMSRKKAHKTFRWKDVEEFLRQRHVELISAGLDEAPMAYKDIEEVMAAQSDLVLPVARFDPRLVKMAPAGERPED